MALENRTLLRVTLPQEYADRAAAGKLVDNLMGKKPEKRFEFIRESSANLESLDI